VFAVHDLNGSSSAHGEGQTGAPPWTVLVVLIAACRVRCAVRFTTRMIYVQERRRGQLFPDQDADFGERQFLPSQLFLVCRSSRTDVLFRLLREWAERMAICVNPSTASIPCTPRMRGSLPDC